MDSSEAAGRLGTPRRPLGRNHVVARREGNRPSTARSRPTVGLSVHHYPPQFPDKSLEALAREKTSPYPKGRRRRKRSQKGTLPAAAASRNPACSHHTTARTTLALNKLPLKNLPAVFSSPAPEYTCCNPRIRLTCSDCCRSPQLKRQRLPGARFIYPSPLAGSTFTPFPPPPPPSPSLRRSIKT